MPQNKILTFSVYNLLFYLLFFFFFLASTHKLWDLISLIRGWTWALSSESSESKSLDCQGIPYFFLFNAEGTSRSWSLYGSLWILIILLVDGKSVNWGSVFEKPSFSCGKVWFLWPSQCPPLCQTVTLCSKSFKLGFSGMWTKKFQMYKLGLEKAEEPEIKFQHLLDHRESKEISEKYLLLFHWLC